MCRAHRYWEMMRAAPSSLEGAPGLQGVVVIVRGDATAEPPAHCRLVPATILSGRWPEWIVPRREDRFWRPPVGGFPTESGTMGEPSGESIQWPIERAAKR